MIKTAIVSVFLLFTLGKTEQPSIYPATPAHKDEVGFHQQVQSLIEGPMTMSSVPCTYWFDNNWYDLTNIESVGSTNFWVSPTNVLQQQVAFNFCQKLSAGADLQPLACDNLDLYALEFSEFRQAGTCTPLSSSSLNSV